jgi:hypothetical protein
MASGIYNRFKANLMKKQVNLHTGGDTIKVALYDDTHAFNAAHHTYTTDNEISGTGYTEGGKTLANQSVTEAATTKFDADPVEWTSATFSTWHAVIYDSTASDSLIASIDFGGEQEVTDATFKIEWHTDGIITLA